MKKEVRIKLWPFTAALLLWSALLALPLSGGCSVFGTDTSAPNAVEQKLFVTQTNYVQVPVQVTNTTYATNTVTQFQTNTVGQIVTVTNTVVQPQYSIVTVTNEIPQYVNTVAPNTAGTVTAAGGIINMFAPGVGSMVSAGAMALLALWAQLRSGKRQQTAAALAQEVELMLEFVQSLPNGPAYKTAITNWLQSHQMEAGVAEQVLDLVEKQVSNPDAKAALEQVKGTISAVQTVATAPK